MEPFSINDNTQLLSVFGFPEYNNFLEEVPFTNKPATLIGFTVSFLALSWIFVLLRLYVRFKVVRMPGWDDLFVMLYLLFTSVSSIAFLLAIKYGSGRHFLLLTLGEVRNYLVLFYVLNFSLNFAATFIKLSQLFQFLRLFDKGSWAYRASVIGIVVISAWGIAYTLLSLFPCASIPDAWNVLARDAKCWAYASQNPDEFVATIVSHNILNTIFDIYIIAIPFQLYSKSGLSLKTRLGLLVLLLMGATVVTLSGWRVYETIYFKAGWYPTRDPTWYGPKSILLIVLEINVASICVSVPIFWPVISPYLGAIFVTHEFSVNYEEHSSSRDRGVNDHYKDSFIMDLVDPLGSSTNRYIRSREKEKWEKSLRDLKDMKDETAV
ncbi:hypothetical protein B0T16DRAFT_457361 [Cercophora newfieldiana]|uniref:Rhodopsin domain-containing protein n=1 Tax=Cercophora newfieldiana TaxID=92897 RepID=A0AA40CSL6_9PEZI|nr:hypothetical protein B0T16DRAFT_457361 [Cercophora newfieldiana]